MGIEFTRAPKSEDIDFLTARIIQETAAIGTASPFAFFIRDEAGAIIAGCNGLMLFNLWLRQWFKLHFLEKGSDLTSAC